MIEVRATLFAGPMRILGWTKDEEAARTLLATAMTVGMWSEPVELTEIPDPVPAPPAPRVTT